MIWEVVLIFESAEIHVAIKVKPTEQFLPVVLFIMLYKVVLTVESRDENLRC